jgi:Trypsin
MTDLFKCKKSGTQCCAPKTKIQEQLDKHNRMTNYTYPYNPNLGPVNPNYPHPQQYYNNYPPPPQNAYPAPPPPGSYPPPPPPNPNYPPPPHVYENTIPPQSSIAYEIPEPTTSPRPPPYSKYVCGVKGNIRTAKEYLVLEGNSTSRRKRNSEFEQEVAQFDRTKTTERLVLGSSPVPIPIIYDDNSTFSFDFTHDTRSVDYSHRQARVVGGEDGENGEWCWQVALINSQNQYLCGGALIGE